jgi:glycosyltransferase involved in cell wall biosynthesis
MPRVSVLIPLYNTFDYIEEAIESVLNQSFTDFELIIVDNRSTDGGFKLIQKYTADPRVSIYQNATNVGMVRNWNQALLYAKGEFIKYLCSDDVFRKNLLEEYVKVMDENPEVSLVTSRRAALYNNHREELWPIHYTGLKKGSEVLEHLVKINVNPIGEPTTVMFRAKHLYIGMFNTDLFWLTDFDYWIRLCGEGDVYFLEDSYSLFRQHEQQGTELLKKSGKAIMEERDFIYYNIFIRSSGFKGEAPLYYTLLETHLKKVPFTDRSILNKYLSIFSLKFISKYKLNILNKPKIKRG